MKRTYFLDKIFNANHNEFEGIIKTIIKEEVGFKEFQYTFFKKKDKWVIDIETGEDLINIILDDYTMYVYSRAKDLTASNTNYWRETFKKFLRKKQLIKYNKNIEQSFMENQDSLRLEDEEVRSYVEL